MSDHFVYILGTTGWYSDSKGKIAAWFTVDGEQRDSTLSRFFFNSTPGTQGVGNNAAAHSLRFLAIQSEQRGNSKLLVMTKQRGIFKSA